MQYCTHGVVLFLFLNVVSYSPSKASPPPDPSDQYSFGPNFNPSTMLIMVILVSIFFLLGFFSVYIRHCVERRLFGIRSGSDSAVTGGGGGSSRRAGNGLDPDLVKSFPTFQYSAVKRIKIGKTSLECAVCINELEDDAMIRLLPKCCHVFHPDCIDAWLVTHSTCPVCRAILIPKPGESLSVQIFEPELNSSPVNIEQEIHESTNRLRLGLFPRSHSTGHSQIRPGENREKFTLLLPDEVRNQLMNSTLNRTKSWAALPTARSSRTGFRTRSGTGYLTYERFDRDEQLDRRWKSMAPPVISKTPSTRGGSFGEESGAVNPPRNLFDSIKSPFDRLFLGINDGSVSQESSDRARLHGQI